MTDAAQLRPARPVDGFEVARIEPPDPELERAACTTRSAARGSGPTASAGTQSAGARTSGATRWRRGSGAWTASRPATRSCGASATRSRSPPSACCPGSPAAGSAARCSPPSPATRGRAARGACGCTPARSTPPPRCPPTSAAASAATARRRMSPRWVVDASNVIGSRPDGWWRDRAGATRRLVAALDALAERTGDEVTVVLDGGEAPPAGASRCWSPRAAAATPPTTRSSSCSRRAAARACASSPPTPSSAAAPRARGRGSRAPAAFRQRASD